ncbi:MAG: hypothetical protein ACOC1T_02875 [Halorhodospira sp.]
MSEEDTPKLNTELARQIQSLGLEAVEEEGEDPMATVEALMLGTLSMARSYMDAPELADYLRFVADHVEGPVGAGEDDEEEEADAG